jgi:predicted Zn-dependent protease with MMP-like domain
MNEIKIPTEFQLYSQIIKVEFNERRCADMDALGACNDALNQILLTTVNSDGDKLPTDAVELTYMHEVVHHILYKMSENDLSKDEKFVSTFSSLLTQALKTSKYVQDLGE